MLVEEGINDDGVRSYSQSCVASITKRVYPSTRLEGGAVLMEGRPITELFIIGAISI